MFRLCEAIEMLIIFSHNWSSSSIGFGISIIIIFIYYTLMTLAGAIGQNSFIPPVIAVWIPNIVTLIAGIYLIRKESK